MIIVHHLENSRSQRVLWLLEEMGLRYEVKRYERDGKTMLAPAELKTVHPLGKSPVIVDAGTTVAETGAIIEYLTGKYGDGRLIPAPDTPERLRCTYWLHYAEGSLMPLMVMKLVFGRIGKAPMPLLLRPLAAGIGTGVQRQWLDPQLKLHLDYVESELGKSPWLAGNAFSAADIQMSFPLEAATRRAEIAGAYPHMVAWVERIHARPAYKRALERGGPYRLPG